MEIWYLNYYYNGINTNNMFNIANRGVLISIGSSTHTQLEDSLCLLLVSTDELKQNGDNHKDAKKCMEKTNML